MKKKRTFVKRGGKRLCLITGMRQKLTGEYKHIAKTYLRLLYQIEDAPTRGQWWPMEHVGRFLLNGDWVVDLGGICVEDHSDLNPDPPQSYPQYPDGHPKLHEEFRRSRLTNRFGVVESVYFHWEHPGHDCSADCDTCRHHQMRDVHRPCIVKRQGQSNDSAS
jgi:hypothetical protein